MGFRKKKISIPKGGILYFINTPETYDNKPLMKIGTTENINQRLASLQTGNPCELKVYKSLRSPKYKDMEKYLHLLCANKKKRGEWFYLGKGEVDALINEVSGTKKKVGGIESIPNNHISWLETKWRNNPDLYRSMLCTKEMEGVINKFIMDYEDAEEVELTDEETTKLKNKYFKEYYLDDKISTKVANLNKRIQELYCAETGIYKNPYSLISY